MCLLFRVHAGEGLVDVESADGLLTSLGVEVGYRPSESFRVHAGEIRHLNPHRVGDSLLHGAVEGEHEMSLLVRVQAGKGVGFIESGIHDVPAGLTDPAHQLRLLFVRHGIEDGFGELLLPRNVENHVLATDLLGAVPVGGVDGPSRVLVEDRRGLV